jgi:hypothetical protein
LRLLLRNGFSRLKAVTIHELVIDLNSIHCFVFNDFVAVFIEVAELLANFQVLIFIIVFSVHAFYQHVKVLWHQQAIDVGIFM